MQHPQVQRKSNTCASPSCHHNPPLPRLSWSCQLAADMRWIWQGRRRRMPPCRPCLPPPPRARPSVRVCLSATGRDTKKYFRIVSLRVGSFCKEVVIALVVVHHWREGDGEGGSLPPGRLFIYSSALETIAKVVLFPYSHSAVVLTLLLRHRMDSR